MFRLEMKSEPFWLNLGLGVRVEVLPFGTEVESRAQDMPEDIRQGLSGDKAAKEMALIKAFGRAAIIGWAGIEVAGRTEKGPWPEGVDALLALSPFGRSFADQYLYPALLAVAEKNAFAPPPNGTSATAETTASTAPDAVPNAPAASMRH
ncbi:hypothetical protein KHC23_13050 [Ancylobacter dichloromethanicus]|uniref:Uncharacterized protein n=1 Tax=Ancylobacter dichloromethanicus TaxID=518825 RepID=A0A9W6MZ47_9HYPH|nr:hypothetical protein [Ancylobacter dichloromethanicus]MBS7554581.1 hypothetical protein [Ancylobacter dichloromethanicus]GLK71711.1 hypothetical protein GCM10017643_18260 [Ancylobacter dichloromethanicus]